VAILALLLIPLLASGISVMLRNVRWMEFVHLLSAVAAFGAAIWLATGVLSAGTVTLFGGSLYVDHLSALVVALTAFVYLAAAPYAVGYLRLDDTGHSFSETGSEKGNRRKLRKYYALTPLFAFCMFMVAVANNLGVMWIAVEGTTLTSIFLVTFYGHRTSLEAAWKYAILGSVGLSMALFGTVLTYYSAHPVLGGESLSTLNWSVLAANAAHFDKTAMRLAFILVLLGYGTKAGLAPMHTWKPDVYSEAPVPVAALMATGVLNCALYALARFYVLTIRCLGPSFASQLLVIFGLLTVGITVPFILVQRSHRRLLAYSSIDHGGIMALSLGFGGILGPLGMLLHMTFHSITKPLLFFCSGNSQQHAGNDSLKKRPSGLLHSLPISAPMFLLAVLAVTGTPPFSMFQSEFMVLRAGFAAQRTGAVSLFVVFVSAIFCGLFYHVAQLVFGAPSGLAHGEFSRWKTYPVIGLSMIVVVLAFWLPPPIYALVDGAAHILEVQP
jgi:hydrogenase-4 component F